MVPRTLAVHWALLGLAMAATIVVLLVKVLAGSGSNGHASDEVNASASSAAQAPAVTTPATSPQADAGVGQVNPASAKTPSDLPQAKSAPGKSLQRKPPPRPDAASVVVAAPATPEPAAIARPPAPPPRAVEASDPWQAMNEGLSRCAREDLFSRAACEQRLRLQYCPNYWGLVPQCPIGPSNDHGQ